MDKRQILYLWDGNDVCKGCHEPDFCMGMCKHTYNMEHAKNLNGNFPIKQLHFKPVLIPGKFTDLVMEVEDDDEE